MSKPTSKVIQIQALPRVEKHKSGFIDVEEMSVIIALCEDGSIWQKCKRWECILESNNDKDK